MYLDSLYLSLVLYFIFILVWVIITYKFGDWRNWRLYYPTILFFCSGNLLGFEVLHDQLLWEFKSSLLSHVTIDIIQMVFIFTCTTILFLQYYPKKFIRQILYILLWVFIYSSIEGVFHLFGGIKYHQGWTFWWSAAHNMYQFIFLRVHYKKPILAWILAFIALGTTMVIFKVSL
jgi:hypothetical protein